MLMLQPDMALLDETDSGLDIDALRIVAEGINAVAKDTGCLIITHYQRLSGFGQARCRSRSYRWENR